MPQMGVSIAEATVLEWKKHPGETVQADEPLLEISTDKAESEVPAPVSGRLAEVMVEAGETVDVGTALARIEPEGTAVQGNRERAAPPTDGDGSPPVTPVVRPSREGPANPAAEPAAPAAEPVPPAAAPAAAGARELSPMRKRIA